MASKHSTKLFVVGPDGNGKSSTVRTIAGDSSETVEIYGTIQVKFSSNNNIWLADGKGVGEPLEDLVENDIEIEEIINNADDVIKQLFKEKLTAIVVVIKFGSKFTIQEKKCFKIVKDIFGYDVLKRRGVVVMTFGDHFDENVQGTFHDWCRKQTGDFKSLMEECNYRCVLFDNRDGSKRESQAKQFMKAVEKIDGTIPFEHAPNSESREKLIKNYTILKARKAIETEEKHIIEKQKTQWLAVVICCGIGVLVLLIFGVLYGTGVIKKRG